MNKITSIFTALLCISVPLSSATAQSYEWKPGGEYKGQYLVFQKGDDYSGKDFNGSVFENEWDIIGVNLDNTNWEGSYWNSMIINDSSFRGANLRFVRDGWLNDTMAGCDVTDADITGANLPLDGEQLRSTKNYKEKNLSGVALYMTDLSGVSFAGFNLTNTTFRDCNLEDCDFTDADITGMRVGNLTFDQLKTTKNYRVKDLGGIVFTNCNFDGADFRGFKLSIFHNCTFRDADLTDAVFTPVNVSGNNRRYGFDRCILTWQQFDSTNIHRDRLRLSEMTMLYCSRLKKLDIPLAGQFR